MASKKLIKCQYTWGGYLTSSLFVEPWWADMFDQQLCARTDCLYLPHGQVGVVQYWLDIFIRLDWGRTKLKYKL